jgi:hypothetical protein
MLKTFDAAPAIADRRNMHPWRIERATRPNLKTPKCIKIAISAFREALELRRTAHRSHPIIEE